MAKTEAAQFQRQLHIKPESYWLKRGERAALRLFSAAAKRVPAYADFLKKHKVNPDKIRTASDLKLVPPTSKEGYLKAYPRSALCWDGKFNGGQWTISTTSGSTGEPFYFPRTRKQDLQYAFTAELYLRELFQIHKKSTLYIVGFPMGAWIGGVFTYQALQIIAGRNKYPLSVITPGINQQEIIKAVRSLGPEFYQIIIGSYGPFLKDTLDEGIRQGIDWKRYKLGFIFSAEGFSENFRDYVYHTAGVRNLYTASLNHYGTVDLGTMSHETPLCILLRRIALSSYKYYQLLFPDPHKLPTLTQYLPEMFYFEEENNRLYCTAESGYPLIRYDLKDHGGISTLESVSSRFSESGVDLPSAIRGAGLKSYTWNLPLVHVYERSDLSVSFYAFQVYPETVRKALLERQFHGELTGKFTMLVTEDARSNQVLEIHAELKPGRTGSAGLRRLVTEEVRTRLLKENSEYRETAAKYPAQTVPKIEFWPYEHELHFKPGAKQKWVKQINLTQSR